MLVTHLLFWNLVQELLNPFENIKSNENITENGVLLCQLCPILSPSRPPLKLQLTNLVCFLKDSLRICKHCNILSFRKKNILMYSSSAFLLLLHKYSYISTETIE